MKKLNPRNSLCKVPTPDALVITFFVLMSITSTNGIDHSGLTAQNLCRMHNDLLDP